jgi:pimeloyl-ACP methyl ester carboxylesterase
MLLVAVVLACAALTFGALALGPAQDASAGGVDTRKPTVVLVHGAWADSSSWNGVISRLRRMGYPVIAAANPMRRLKSDSDYIASVLRAVDGPIVLVGHAYAGSVITNAAAGNPNVKALVYVAAFAPEPGEGALGIIARFPGSTLAQTTVAFPLPGGGEDLYIKQDQYHQQIAADVPAHLAALMAVTQRPGTRAAFSDPSSTAAWKSIPSWFVFGSADRNIPAAAHRFMAKRAGAKRTVEIPGASHSVAVSHPGAVAELITEAANSP